MAFNSSAEISAHPQIIDRSMAAAAPHPLSNLLSTSQITCDDINRVHLLIEKLMRFYKTPQEVVIHAQQLANVPPYFTRIIWGKLVEGNQAYFEAYFKMLGRKKLRKQRQMKEMEVVRLPVPERPFITPTSTRDLQCNYSAKNLSGTNTTLQQPPILLKQRNYGVNNVFTEYPIVQQAPISSALDRQNDCRDYLSVGHGFMQRPLISSTADLQNNCEFNNLSARYLIQHHLPIPLPRDLQIDSGVNNLSERYPIMQQMAHISSSSRYLQATTGELDNLSARYPIMQVQQPPISSMDHQFNCGGSMPYCHLADYTSSSSNFQQFPTLEQGAATATDTVIPYTLVSISDGDSKFASLDTGHRVPVIRAEIPVCTYGLGPAESCGTGNCEGLQTQYQVPDDLTSLDSDIDRCLIGTNTVLASPQGADSSNIASFYSDCESFVFSPTTPGSSRFIRGPESRGTNGLTRYCVGLQVPTSIGTDAFPANSLDVDSNIGLLDSGCQFSTFPPETPSSDDIRARKRQKISNREPTDVALEDWHIDWSEVIDFDCLTVDNLDVGEDMMSEPVMHSEKGNSKSSCLIHEGTCSSMGMMDLKKCA